MAYIGSKPTIGNFQICDAISVVNGQAAYTMQVGSVNVIPQSANHMIVSLNGVIQKPGSSFTVSGSTITFASNLATGDVIDFIQILGDVLDLGVPSDDTVTAAKLVANSVTAAKLNNDIISGSTELATAPADTDEFLVSDAGTLKRIDYSLIKGGGITMVDNWRVNSSFTGGDANPIASNWERNDSSAPAFGYYGSQMTESSGIFSFPSTGIYLILANLQFYLNGNSQYVGVEIYGTNNNSSYSPLSINYGHISSEGNPTYSTVSTNATIDITNISNQKVRFRQIAEDPATTTVADSTYDHTFVRFIRLGDT
jgi:hypothetical protein